ncbi:MAG: hypothetical protein Ct9H300mP28_13010 [Pseudomonadota bacterium]|nr:MAG: hypothetical protein Ct9H300mP28_13010 [Pseudomonadota bacterium]
MQYTLCTNRLCQSFKTFHQNVFGLLRIWNNLFRGDLKQSSIEEPWREEGLFMCRSVQLSLVFAARENILRYRFFSPQLQIWSVLKKIKTQILCLVFKFLQDSLMNCYHLLSPLSYLINTCLELGLDQCQNEAPFLEI